jgi:hypothetical protein
VSTLGTKKGRVFGSEPVRSARRRRSRETRIFFKRGLSVGGFNAVVGVVAAALAVVDVLAFVEMAVTTIVGRH